MFPHTTHPGLLPPFSLNNLHSPLSFDGMIIFWIIRVWASWRSSQCLSCMNAQLVEEGLAHTGDSAQVTLWCWNCEHCHVFKALVLFENQKMGHLTDGASILCHITIILNKMLFVFMIAILLIWICLILSLLKPFYMGGKWDLSTVFFLSSLY